MSEEEEKTEGDAAPSMNLEKRPNQADYKSEDGELSSSDTTKTTDFTSVTTVPSPEGDVQVETELEIPLEDNKENVKSEIKPPKVKTLSEEEQEVEEPSFTTVSKEELSDKSSEKATR
jgi:hypothetical protein